MQIFCTLQCKKYLRHCTIEDKFTLPFRHPLLRLKGRFAGPFFMRRGLDPSPGCSTGSGWIRWHGDPPGSPFRHCFSPTWHSRWAPGSCASRRAKRRSARSARLSGVLLWHSRSSYSPRGVSQKCRPPPIAALRPLPPSSPASSSRSISRPGTAESCARAFPTRPCSETSPRSCCRFTVSSPCAPCRRVDRGSRLRSLRWALGC